MNSIPQPDFDIQILVIDDDAMVRSVILGYLGSFGFTKIIAIPGGEQALKLIHDKKLHIDLILCDWEMPEIDGYTILRAARKSPLRTKVKFIMVTSQQFHERKKISMARLWRVDAYIVKPFIGEILQNKIWAVLGWDKAGLHKTTA